MRAHIKAIATYLPERVETNAMNRLTKKTGILSRHVVDDNECASDLAFNAAEKLFANYSIDRELIDFVVLCTQSPDYYLPTTACVLQRRLHLSKHCGAFDFNLGCSGYVYGLSIAKGLIETHQANNILLLTSETYSKYIHPDDNTVRPLFGDAATATLISAENTDQEGLYAFHFGTNGEGAEHLIVPAGAARNPAFRTPIAETIDDYSNRRTNFNLFMNGSAITEFALDVVPRTVVDILAKAKIDKDQVDYFVFHQANRFMLDFLQQKCELQGVPFWNDVETTGNTVSCTIPLAIEALIQKEESSSLSIVMLVGFGVGLSWAGCLVDLSSMIHN